jgi:hypothetical protein
MPAFDVPSNLAFDDYGSLVDAINDWLDRNDLSGVAQQMVALAESRMRRKLLPFFLEKTSSVVTTAGLGVLPSDFGTLCRVIYETRTLPQYGSTAAPVFESGIEPWAYSLEGGGLRLWPSGDFTVTLLYQPTVPQLSEANPTSDLLDAHPDLYLFGSLMFAEGYLANDSRAATFKGLFDEAMEETRLYLVSQKWGGPLVPKVMRNP